jgi:acid phosphatase
MSTRTAILTMLACALLAGPLGAAPRELPRPAHVIVIVDENKAPWQLVGNRDAPYINALIARGAFFTDSHGVMHPSLPNYLALFAGVTNTNGDGCPATGIDPGAPNLASELHDAHQTFAGYSEGLPHMGFTGCWAGNYARKHAPWVAFSNVAPSQNLSLSAFPSYDKLPTVAFVVPDVEDDMHNGSIGEGDVWLAKWLPPLLAWAEKHDTLIVLTWDEGFDLHNTIVTVFLGPMVRPGKYPEHIDHVNVLRTLEDLYRLPHAGRSGQALSIIDCWR